MPIVRFQRGAEERDQPDPFVTAAELASAIGVDLVIAERLLAVVGVLVNDYAPEAPEALRREAAIRAAGWLADSLSSNTRSQTIGPMSVDYAPSQRGALLHSGAKSLLYPYRRKTTGVAK